MTWTRKFTGISGIDLATQGYRFETLRYKVGLGCCGITKISLNSFQTHVLFLIAYNRTVNRSLLGYISSIASYSWNSGAIAQGWRHQTADYRRLDIMELLRSVLPLVVLVMTTFPSGKLLHPPNEEPARFIRYAALASIIPNSPFS
jgi:hypothetical protein